MPIPKPHKGEKQSDFHGRCMSAIWEEYGNDPAQANAICYTSWKNRKKDRKKEQKQKAEALRAQIGVARSQIVQNTPNQNFLVSSGPGAPKASKATANYVNHPVAGHQCSQCVMFIPNSKCTAVQGKISRNGHCKYWQSLGTANLERAIFAALQKAHHTGEGIDPENARDVTFPVCPDDLRAEITHIAWHTVANEGVKLDDLPKEMVPFDKVVATQPQVDEKRVEDHAKEFEADGGYDGDDPVVVKLDGKFYIIDGHHRCEGAKEAGAKELQMSVINGDGTKKSTTGDPVSALLSVIGPAKGSALIKSGDNLDQGAPPKQLVIGLVGPSGAHKTVAAKHLKKAHGFKRIHAGEPVKRALRKGFRLKKKQTARSAKDQPTLALGGATPRAALEAMGDGLHDVAPHATSKVMQKRIIKRLAKGHSVVVDGVRTPEEADTIHRLGGHLVRVSNGKGHDPRKPMDVRQKDIKCNAELDSSQGKDKLKSGCDDLMHKMGMPMPAAYNQT